MGGDQSRPTGGNFYAEEGSEESISDVGIDGAAVAMSRFAGRVSLVVNVATA